MTKYRAWVEILSWDRSFVVVHLYGILFMWFVRVINFVVYFIIKFLYFLLMLLLMMCILSCHCFKTKKDYENCFNIFSLEAGDECKINFLRTLLDCFFIYYSKYLNISILTRILIVYCCLKLPFHIEPNTLRIKIC